MARAGWYGTAHSKLQFVYPENEGPTNKKYVEPDFAIGYSNQTYKANRVGTARSLASDQVC